jgi:hypothetical protein
MFSVITNIYNKKTKGPTLIELFTATGKLKKVFWQLEMFDVCTTGDTAHIGHLWLSKKLFQFSCGCEQFHYGRSFGFLVINVCNRGEYYETPCILYNLQTVCKMRCFWNHSINPISAFSKLGTVIDQHRRNWILSFIFFSADNSVFLKIQSVLVKVKLEALLTDV